MVELSPVFFLVLLVCLWFFFLLNKNFKSIFLKRGGGVILTFQCGLHFVPCFFSRSSPSSSESCFSQVYLSGGVVNYPVRDQFQSLGIFVLCSRRLIRSQEDISVVIHGLDFRTSDDISSKLGALPVFLTAFTTCTYILFCG